MCRKTVKSWRGLDSRFSAGFSAGLADRLRFLMANPAVREAAGLAARKTIFITGSCTFQP
jgi:hypothetical protein